MGKYYRNDFLYTENYYLLIGTICDMWYAYRYIYSLHTGFIHYNKVFFFIGIITIILYSPYSIRVFSVIILRHLTLSRIIFLHSSFLLLKFLNLLFCKYPLYLYLLSVIVFTVLTDYFYPHCICVLTRCILWWLIPPSP